MSHAYDGATPTAAAALVARATEAATPSATAMTESNASQPQITIDVSYLFDWGNTPGMGPYFTANNIDAAQQITTAALMGSACLVVFSMLRYKWPELYSHRLRLRQMRPPNIPRTLFGWMYPVVTMSDRHVLETIGLDALLFFRAYRMFIYMFISLSAFGMMVLYPVNYRWAKEDSQDSNHTIFESPIAQVTSLTGRYSIAHVMMAYVFAGILFFYIDRFALHTITMRWHYLLLTRRSGNSRTLMVTHLPRELRSEQPLERFIRGMQVGQVERVHVAPESSELTDALAHRARVLARLESAYVAVLGNPCRARSYDPELLRRVVLTDTTDARALERQLLHRWARHHRGDRKGRLRERVGRPQMTMMRTRTDSGARPWWWWWPFVRLDAIDHWRQELFKADERLQRARQTFGAGAGSSSAFVIMTRPEDAYTLAQLSVHARPGTCKIRMAPEARSIVWRSVGRPLSAKMLRYLIGLVMTVALLLLWCVPVVLISTLISLRFLVTRSPSLAAVVRNSQFVRSLLSYTLPSLILTIFMTILPRLLWTFVLVGGDRAYVIADKNMFIRHWYFLVVYIIVIFGMSGTVWASIYDIFTNFTGFWDKLVAALPQMATWYSVYTLLYGAGYQVMKLLHLKSVCRFLFHQARARTPRDYMKAISPVFIDYGTFQPYTVLFFFIGILYAHLQPLLLPMCMVYFVVGLFVMKYMCVYAWYFRQQAAGAIWPVIFRRMAACVLAYQALTTAIFAGGDNRWFVAPMVVLMLGSWYYFWVRCKDLRRLAESVPLQLLREADRRRRVTLLRERKEQLSATGSSGPQPPSIHIDSGPMLYLPAADMAAAGGTQDLESQPLVPQKEHPPRTRRWLAALLHNAIVHPAQAVVSSVSYAIVWLKGDPAAPLLEHLDDYAFPERVKERAHPAGRSADNPELAKEQPGSLLDVLRSTVVGIPRGFAAIGSEFFVTFHVPRAHLDTSIVSYPRAENVDSAFLSGHAQRRLTVMRQRLASRPSDDGEHADHVDSASQMHFCLASADRPPAAVPCIGESREGHPLLAVQPRIERVPTSVPPLDSHGQPIAMQYQELSSELPFGTSTNRKRTDFSQPNMSYLPGILDSTRFAYMHPGMYGDIPSLWLPVQCLKRRNEIHKSMRQRLKGALNAVESALQDNIIGERAVQRLGEKRREMSQRVRDSRHLTPFGTRQSSRRSSADNPREKQSAVDSSSIDITDGQVVENSSIASSADQPSRVPENMTTLEVQQKMDDLHVESKCSALGICPDIVRNWDPTGLHRSTTFMQLADNAPDSVALAEPASTITDSDSEYDDTESNET